MRFASLLHMNARMLLGGASFLVGSALASAQTDIAVLEAYPCDGNGNVKAVQVGESFWVGARFRVTGVTNSSFKYRAETAFGKVESPRLEFGQQPGEYFVYWGPIPTLMDGSFEVKVTLDPEKKVRESNRLNNVATFTLSPTSPNQAVEYFDARQLVGRMGLDLQFKRNSALPSNLTFWLPKPNVDTFQTPESRSSEVSLIDIVADPFGQPIYSESQAPASLDPIHKEVQVQGMALAQRSNFELLRQMGRYADPQEAQWLQAEALVELGRPEFSQWILRALSPLELETLSHAEIARALYRSILRNCTYQYKPGEEPSALTTLKKKKGDCGALSSLFVALCRTAGIPARTVAGFTVGQNKWHVWAEFHVNGAGWVSVDPAYAEGRLAKGADLPIYFGVVPDLNQRVATAYGLDRWANGRSVEMLQSPAVFWEGRNVRIQKFGVFSELGFGL